MIDSGEVSDVLLSCYVIEMDVSVTFDFYARSARIWTAFAHPHAVTMGPACVQPLTWQMRTGSAPLHTTLEMFCKATKLCFKELHVCTSSRYVYRLIHVS